MFRSTRKHNCCPNTVTLRIEGWQTKLEMDMKNYDYNDIFLKMSSWIVIIGYFYKQKMNFQINFLVNHHFRFHEKWFISKEWINCSPNLYKEDFLWSKIILYFLVYFLFLRRDILKWEKKVCKTTVGNWGTCFRNSEKLWV